MDRSEALAPLKAGEARLPLTAGFIVRGQIRRAALVLGVDYYEEKGLFESTFVLRGARALREKLQQKHFGD